MNKFLTYILTVLFLIICVQKVSATHNRAGEITYEQISDLTYKITITTYTCTGPGYTADRPELTIFWGDNTSSILPRVEKIQLPDYYQYNRYEGTHTFPGPGIYELVVEDPNRNAGVDNIPNSVNVVFSISTIMSISAEGGSNSTPVLTQPPVDKGAVGQVFIHNPGAYDPDGDSISYAMTTCRGENGEPIEGYTLPEASNSLTINAVSGDLIWDTPVEAGVYNIAILIEEWRNGVKIGKIIRDMQIEIFDTDNESPEVIANEKLCVEAGTKIEMTVLAEDPDGDELSMSANGAPFLISDSYATFEYEYLGNGQAEGLFVWQTLCDYVRQQPYLVNFKATDNASPISLVDIKNVNIYVIGPATEWADISSTTTTITLNWHPNKCNNVTGYKIYRSNEPIDWTPGECTRGVPDDIGYAFIGTTDSHSDTIFLDNNNGTGLPQGFVYCYRVVAVFPDGAESYASEEICTELVRGIPTITNVSVDSTDTENGKIYLAWSKPTEFDSIAYPGPYKYLIYRSDSLWGENLQLIDSTENINDTTFHDNGLNTKDTAWSYLVEFYSDEPGNRVLIGTPHVASSIFLRINEKDNALELDFEKNVPWQNLTYTVYRENPVTGDYDSIAATPDILYVDSLLINGNEYCYKIKSTGEYTTSGYVDPIINWSQINCGTPKDTAPPCPPHLDVSSYCDSLYNHLTWTMADSCLEDTHHYKIYYKINLDDDYAFLDSTQDRNTMQYKHYPELTMAACYVVTAVDSFYNESALSNSVCVDNCTYYELPNVFTPNNDGINDYFHPKMPYFFVDHVDMKIYNRWGQLVFQTTDPDIMWDGRIQKNNNLVSDGVYFYTCDVYEYRLTGIEPRNMNGTIHVYTSGQQPDPSQVE
ncbi:MAG: gliding motility-associated C-terminal domain-containing protein [Bacteroidota bacterium]|nr:gliding motility-associated C-terminal domain-containing protein [Bacteroidota bacterium]